MAAVTQEPQLVVTYSHECVLFVFHYWENNSLIQKENYGLYHIDKIIYMNMLQGYEYIS